MAKVTTYTDFPSDYTEQVAALEALRTRSANLPAGSIQNVVLQFQVADGYAFYIVTSAYPLVVAHIPFLDAYSIPQAHVRGLQYGDVLDEHRRERALRELHYSL